MERIGIAYNLPSRDALIELIKRSYPERKINAQHLEFGDMYSDPTPEEPGRTFVEMVDTITRQKEWYVYRRLNLGIVLRDHTTISLEGLISPKRIVEALNLVAGLYLNATDVIMDDVLLAPKGYSFTYRMKALPESYVWYGGLSIQVVSLSFPDGARMLENGGARLVENGDFRFLESF